MEKTFIVVPAYDPEEEIMLEFINELHKEFKNILIVNDGSNKKHDKFFESFKNMNIEVISNYKNMGKGRAMKYAFNHILNNYPDIIGCVTCDCDGQHTVADVKKLNDYLLKNTDELILGVRDFNESNVPFKSRYGNKITRSILKNIVGCDISDTQTGLRGFSRKLMTDFLDIPGERYEYETRMLVDAKKNNIPFKEIVIETVYLNDNKGSHFNPIKDSIKIYKTFSSNLAKIVLNYIINILLFVFIYNFSKNAIASCLASGLITTVLYTLLNKKLLFNKRSIKFYITYYLTQVLKIGVVAILLNYFIVDKFILLFKLLYDFVISFLTYIVRYNIKTNE